MEPTSTPVDVDGFRASMREVGVEEIVEETLEVFVDEAQRIFADLSAAVVAGDVQTLRVSAHTLKSSSGNVWAHDLAALLRDVEAAAGGGGDLASATEIFRRAEPEYEAVISYLTSLGAGR